MKQILSIMTFAISVAFLCSCNSVDKNNNITPASDDSRSDAPVTYGEVKTDPARYIGKQVTWVAASFSAAITSEAITKFWKVEGEDDDAVFATIQEDEKRTDAAKARDTIRFDFTRKVIGTISRDQIEYRKGPNVIKVPLLTKVVVDAVDAASIQ